MKGMLSASLDEDATSMCSGCQGRRIRQESGDAARSRAEYGEQREAGKM